MAEAETMTCEVAYARPDRQFVVSVILPAGATAGEAVLRSELSTLCPEIVVQSAVLGIFGKVVPADHRLRDGDRVEVYRPLTADPRAARRARAKAASKR
jgi:putative ubiquitin-RnfH superfamily antitoxin RatB of RatAB toxin-antitoxin module